MNRERLKPLVCSCASGTVQGTRTSGVNLSTCTGFEIAVRNAKLDASIHHDCMVSQYGHGAVMLGHRVMVFGGVRDSHAQCLFTFDMVQDEWSSRKVALGDGRDLLGHIRMACTRGDKIYAYTKLHKTGDWILVELDCVLRNEWIVLDEAKASKLNKNAKPVYYEKTEDIVVRTRDGLLMFSLETKTWTEPKTKGAAPILGRRQAGCATATGVCFAARGANLTLHNLNMKTLTWSEVQVNGSYIPRLWQFQTLVGVPGRIYAVGGSFGRASLDVFIVSERKWYRIALYEGSRTRAGEFRLDGHGLASGLVGHTVVHDNNIVLCLGGLQAPDKLRQYVVIRPTDKKTP